LQNHAFFGHFNYVPLAERSRISCATIEFLTISKKEKVSITMQDRTYRYEDLNSLDDQSLGVILSECPYRLLTLALKATQAPLKERILSLLTGSRKQLVLNDLEGLRFNDLGELRDLVTSEISLAHREIIRIAKHLKDNGQILAGT
jgi:flagellar motor switch protein FliG